jgi:hypothetical protein
VLAMLTVVSHFKKGMHWVWVYFQTRLAFIMAAFVLGQWQGFMSLSGAEFSLYGKHLDFKECNFFLKIVFFS